MRAKTSVKQLTNTIERYGAALQEIAGFTFHESVAQPS